MRRRHRRVLLNLFAFSLLGVAVYLNIYRMNDTDMLNKPARAKAIVKITEKAAAAPKIIAKEIHPK